MSAKTIDAHIESHVFGDIEVLRDIRFDVSHNEIVAVVGPSGCGKTTLLNLLSGALPPTRGHVAREGPTRTVYQQDGLLPWLTVADNINLGLRHISDSREKLAVLETALAMIGMETFRDHYPYQLSGGMRQRAELARSLVSPAPILLMDEPFSALDYMTRVRMRQELARLLHDMPRTVVLVTHDIEEAAQLADRIVLLSRRPTTVLDQFTVRVARPRHVTQPEVVATVARLLALLNLDSPSAPDAADGRRIPLTAS